MRNHHHNSESIISALPLASDIQNDICRIKNYRVTKNNSKEYINNLKNRLISAGGEMFFSVFRANENISNHEKIEALNNAFTYTAITTQYLDKLAYNESIDIRKATNIANDLHTLKYRIDRWRKYIENKDKDKDKK